MKLYIRGLLLECFAEETEKSARNKIGDAVAEVARQLSDAGMCRGTLSHHNFSSFWVEFLGLLKRVLIQLGYLDELWPELLNALFLASKMPDASHREGAFRIFATTPGIIEKQHGDIVQKVFISGFEDLDMNVRLAAMEAFSAFFRSIKKAAQKLFYPLLTYILNILVPIKDTQDSDNLSKALMALIDLAELAPLMFKPLFNNVVKFGISVVQDKDLGDQARQNALELLATFADNAPIMCKKDPIYTTEMVTQCLSLMTDIGNDDDDAVEWNDSDDVSVRFHSGDFLQPTC